MGELVGESFRRQRWAEFRPKLGLGQSRSFYSNTHTQPQNFTKVTSNSSSYAPLSAKVTCGSLETESHLLPVSVSQSTYCVISSILVVLYEADPSAAGRLSTIFHLTSHCGKATPRDLRIYHSGTLLRTHTHLICS